MAEPRIKTTIEFDPSDYERLRAYADHHDIGLASAIIGLLDGKLARVPFQAPSVEDVAQHCKEKGYTFDPEAFVAFYESKGWKIGHQPMRKWKSACVTWNKRQSAEPVTVSASKPEPKVDPVQEEVMRDLEEARRLRKERGLE